MMDARHSSHVLGLFSIGFGLLGTIAVIVVLPETTTVRLQSALPTYFYSGIVSAFMCLALVIAGVQTQRGKVNHIKLLTRVLALNLLMWLAIVSAGISSTVAYLHNPPEMLIYEHSWAIGAGLSTGLSPQFCFLFPLWGFVWALMLQGGQRRLAGGLAQEPKGM